MGGAEWTPGRARDQRRRRYVAELEDYIRSAALAGEGCVQEEWTRFVLAAMPPITTMGLFTFPDEFGGADRRRWTFRAFMEERYRAGHYLAAEEPHQSGELHFHAVMSGQERRLSVMDGWKAATDGGLAWIREPRSVEDVVGYCVKYVSKGYLSGQSDLRLGMPAPASCKWEHEVRRGFNPPWRPRRPGEEAQA